MNGCDIFSDKNYKKMSQIYQIDPVESYLEKIDETDGRDGSEFESASLVRVVDGDTIVVKKGDDEVKVRLIGIDTPESVHEDESKNTIWGDSASNYTKSVLEGIDTVYLEYDEEEIDKYGRDLAYVWLTASGDDLDNMLNAMILDAGYAIDKVYEPNDNYAKEFKQICDNSRTNLIGLWAEPEFAQLH